MSKQPPPWFNKMPIVSHWNIKQKTVEYFLKQSVSLVQNMVCLRRFVLGRSSKDGVSSYASPYGPFQHRGNCPRVQEQSIPDQRQGGTVQPILSRNRRQRIHPSKNMKKQCKKLEMIHRMYVQMMIIHDKWCMNENCPGTVKVGVIWNPIKSRISSWLLSRFWIVLDAFVVHSFYLLNCPQEFLPPTLVDRMDGCILEDLPIPAIEPRISLRGWLPQSLTDASKNIGPALACCIWIGHFLWQVVPNGCAPNPPVCLLSLAFSWSVVATVHQIW